MKIVVKDFEQDALSVTGKRCCDLVSNTLNFRKLSSEVKIIIVETSSDRLIAGLMNFCVTTLALR